jgi:hypothetical protein
MRESELQRRCLGWVARERRGSLIAVNVHGGGWTSKGFPDLLLIGGGHVVAVELKAGSGYAVQPDQQVWRNRFIGTGTPHYVAGSLDEFKEIVRKEFGDVGA